MTQPTSGPTVETVAVRANEATVHVDGVRVRWRIPDGRNYPSVTWLCDECGTHDVPTCNHAAHAAATIAQHLLGLPTEVTTTVTTRTTPSTTISKETTK